MTQVPLNTLADALANTIIFGGQIEVHATNSISVKSSVGYGIHLREDKGKVIVTGLYPRGEGWGDFMPYDASPPKVTCSLSRSPDAIVKDIGKRFLSDYADLWKQCKEREEEHLEYLERQKSLAQTLVDMGADVRSNDTFYIPGCRGRIGSDSVTLDIYSVPLEKALRILSILKEE